MHETSPALSASHYNMRATIQAITPLCEISSQVDITISCDHLNGIVPGEISLKRDYIRSILMVTRPNLKSHDEIVKK